MLGWGMYVHTLLYDGHVKRLLQGARVGLFVFRLHGVARLPDHGK